MLNLAQEEYLLEVDIANEGIISSQYNTRIHMHVVQKKKSTFRLSQTIKYPDQLHHFFGYFC